MPTTIFFNSDTYCLTVQEDFKTVVATIEENQFSAFTPVDSTKKTVVNRDAIVRIADSF